MEDIEEAEALLLKEYIGRYCKREEHIEIVFNELVGGGHKDCFDPFVQYIVPVLASRVAIDETVYYLDKINENLAFLSLKKIEQEQIKILNKIENIEKIIFEEKIKNLTVNKSDKLLAILAMIIVGIVSGAFFLSLSLSSANYFQNQKDSQQSLLESDHEQYRKY